MRATRTTPTVRMLASLLPPTWPDRAAALRTAAGVDRALAGDASAVLLCAWRRWRETGAVPADAQLRDLLGVLGLLLGGIASEMRLRPRMHRRGAAPAC